MQPVWLFDYDRTLYGPDEEHVFDGICAAICGYVERHLDLDVAEAERRRKDWNARYGATLLGLVHEHGHDPEVFFDRVHADPVAVLPAPRPDRAERLLALPGERHIFTNARGDWAERGLASMGMRHAFDQVFDLRFHGWKGKPDPDTYARMARHLGGDERRFIFLDDSLNNLLPARDRGWRCVWVQAPADAVLPPGIERLDRIDDVATLLAG